MKTYNSIVKSAILLALIVSLLGCKKDENPDPLNARLNQLAKTWQLGEVVNDDVNVTDQFTGFTLTVKSDKSFTTQNGGNAWPSIGTFEFINNDTNKLLRNDGIEITIISINASILELKFTQLNSPGGRASGITGEFNFSLIN